MKQLLNEVLEEIKPSKEYEKDILEKACKIINLINKGLKNAKALLGGSGAKGTWLKTFDADIFVKFSYYRYKDKDEKLSNILESFLKKHFKIIRLHGSRDYFQIKQGKFTFEIVPLLDIKNAEQAKNITDVSPLHAKFVLKHKKSIDEIRLTKQFFKAIGVYGAESYIRGFSGYVCEILTIYYGSFMNLINAASKWKEKTVIDIKDYYKGKNVLMELNKSKLVSPLIVIDPVQKDRNAAAALSYEKFDMSRKKVNEFIKNPSKEFFKIKSLTEEDIIRSAGKDKPIMLKVNPLERKEDVAGAKMFKALNYISKKLISSGFAVISYDVVWDKKDKALFYYILKNDRVSKTIKLEGPPLKIKRHVRLFKKKHKSAFIKNNRVYALEERAFTDAKELVKSVIKDFNVRDNVRKVAVIAKSTKIAS